MKLKKSGNKKIYNHGVHKLCEPGSPYPDEIHINEINQSKIQMNYDFNEADNNITLIWYNNINITRCMFFECSNITEINLTNFDASLVKDMAGMFNGCSSLKNIDFTNFNTSQVEYMDYMFYSCTSINSLDLSVFNTSQVISMFQMFFNCKSLYSLDLSNFNTTKVNNMKDIFKSCSKLKYFNLENTILSDDLITQIKNFNQIIKELVICTRDINLKNKFSLIEYINCNDNYIINKLDHNDFKCFKRDLINENNNDYSCEICGKYYYKIYNDSNNNKSYINCYKSPEGYYLDNLEESFYKKCYSTCKKCNIAGNKLYHNCIECNDNNIFYMNMSNYFNCYNNCTNYYYFDKITNKTHCTNNLICPDDYHKLILNRSECVEDCNKDPIFSFEYDGICYDKNIGFYLSEISINQTNQINTSIQIIKSELINTDNIYNNTLNQSEFENIIKNIIKKYSNLVKSNEKDLEFKTKNLSITLTTTHNQKEYINENKSSINLGKCENQLKLAYNISFNDSLFILKIDKKEEGMKIPKIEYEVYYPFYNYELTLLNLTFCKNTKIDIFIPVRIAENLNKYNSSSDYYNNICSKTTSKSETDISLPDRKKEFINNNMTLCEEDCNLIEYNYTNEKAKCSCLIKIKLPFLEDIKFDKNKLYKSFTDIKNIVNIKLMKCYKNAFNKKSLRNNYGFFIYISTFILLIITFFLFYCKYYFYLTSEINKISEAKINILKSNQKKSKNIITNNINLNNERKITKKDKRKNIINKGKGKSKHNKKNKNIFKKSNKSSLYTINNKNNLNKNNNNNIHNSNDNTDKNMKKYEEILKYNDNEMNSLLYEKALISDKRTFSQYYFSLLRTGHLFIFSFYSNNNDYNSQIIKIFLFFFFFCVNFLVNTLFFNDNTIHKIYEDQGSFNFIYQIPQIIYSSLISGIINKIIKYLSLSGKKIIEIKLQKSVKDVNQKTEEILNVLRVKFSLFFIVAFLCLSLFMYYITCFCGIYINTQIHLIKDSFISFGISMTYPFGIYLLPGILRIYALNAPTKDKKYMFKFSQLIQNL